MFNHKCFTKLQIISEAFRTSSCLTKYVSHLPIKFSKPSLMAFFPPNKFFMTSEIILILFCFWETFAPLPVACTDLSVIVYLEVLGNWTFPPPCLVFLLIVRRSLRKSWYPQPSNTYTYGTIFKISKMTAFTILGVHVACPSTAQQGDNITHSAYYGQRVKKHSIWFT